MNLKKIIIGRFHTRFDDAILNHMSSSGEFSSTEVLLWEYFCSLVKFKQDRRIMIFRAQLAAMIHRSEPTVTRHVRSLVNKGFLIRKINSRGDCHNNLKKLKTANTYQVCLPEQIYSKIRERDDKQKRKLPKALPNSVENSEKKIVNSSSADRVKFLEQTTSNSLIGNSLPIKKDAEDGAALVVDSSYALLIKKDQSINIKKANINTKNNKQTDTDSTTHSSEPNNTTSNFVVACEKIEAKLKANRTEIDLLKHKKSIANAKLATSYEALSKHQALEEYTTLDSLQIRLATENQVLEQRLKQLKIQQQSQTDSSWIASIDGARPINERLRCYLKRKLHEIGYDTATEEGCAKFNEIIWS